MFLNLSFVIILTKTNVRFFQTAIKRSPAPSKKKKTMLNEKRSHKQQHCLRENGAGRNIMAEHRADIGAGLGSLFKVTLP